MADPYFLERFVKAQAPVYPTALREIRQGAKCTHWMWFIFPQLVGLGQSPTARHFAIRCAEEAEAYLAHPVLGARYLECVRALQDLDTSDPFALFGEIDAAKLRSSLTLFVAVRPQPLFAATLDRCFGGERDQLTIRFLRRA